MTASLRRFLAMLLLVLLPLQALAASYASADAPAMPCPPEMMAMGCCDDGTSSCAGDTCVAAAAVAALPSAPLAATAPTRFRALSAAPLPLHPDHIPDGPQRPPCAHL